MELKKAPKRNYKTFDQTEAIRKAQETIDKLKLKHKNIQSFRVDKDTVVQVVANRKNKLQIVERIKNKKHSINIVEQLEYGQYA